MTPEPLPDDCLPRPDVIDRLLRGPDLDDAGRIVGGTYDGMTPEDVLRQRDQYNRLCGE